MKRMLPLALIVMLLLAACGGGGPNPVDAPDAVVDYLNALVAKETEAVISLSCAEYEEQARREVDSFAGVEVTLDGVACFLEDPNATGEEVVVNCEGAIVATYNDEDQRLELERLRYVTQYEAGAWRVCGYSE